MKILLLQDVYKLGRAGDVKKVANGYGRNYLIPHGLAVLATPGALKMVDNIRVEADKQRSVLNEELGGLAEQMQAVVLTFPVRASETGRLYGSVNTRMIAEALSQEVGVEISHSQIDAQPLRTIGSHSIEVRLTVDLIPAIEVIVHREGESPEAAVAEAEAREELTYEDEAAEVVYLDEVEPDEVESDEGVDDDSPPSVDDILDQL
ncbi:MAG: 50S ribosomal protein L9 [Chloroflexi bacterium]|jgi:large subunit ribosomal protein L9|nr:50S ribosomal protein L9 [Chloroflexota bacterium]